jgi:lambda family phage portal protein
MLGWLRRIFRPTPRAVARPPRLRASYDAARTTADNRRHWDNADALSARTANSPDVRKKLRERARYESANNSYLRGIVLTLANDLIGTGPRLQVLTDRPEVNRAVERAWAQWSRAVYLAQKLRTMKQAKTVDGEALAAFITNQALPTSVKLDLRLFETEQCQDPPDLVGTFRPDIVDGIRFDAAGNPVAYFLLDQHPADAFGSGTFGTPGRWHPARSVIHWFRSDRPGQARGVPEITPALPLFAQLRRYTLAVLTAAETSADFAAVLKTQSGANTAADQLEGEPFEQLEIDRGLMTTLPAGWDLGGLKNDQPATTYDMFQRAILKEIARCLSVPYNVAAGDSSSYNYASGRLDHQTHFKDVDVERDDCTWVVIERILAAFLDEAVMIPGLLPDGVDVTDLPHVWQFDGREHVDPVKESTAQATRLQNNLTTLAYEYARQGQDWEEALRQRAKELALMTELGLPLAPAASQPPPANPQDTTDPEDTADEEATAAGTAGRIAAAGEPSSLRICGASEGLELLAAEGDGGKRLRKFSMTAYTGVPMQLRGFGWPVVVDLAGVQVPSQRRPILRDHDLAQIVGHTEAVDVTAQRIKVSGTMSGVGQAANEVLGLADNGFPWQASIGADIGRLEFVDRGESVKVNGRNVDGPVYVVRASTLGEVSFVAIGADGNTSATVAAQPGEKGTNMTFEKWLEAKGWKLETLSEVQKQSLQAAWKAETAPPPAPAPTPTPAPPPAPPPAAAPPPTRTVDEVVNARRQEEGRQSRIAELVAEAMQSGGVGTTEAELLGRTAITANWDLQRVELELLRAGRPALNGIVRAGSNMPQDESVIEAAVCMAGRLENVEKVFSAQTLEAARKRWRNGLGLGELILTFARRNGFNGLSINGALKSALRCAFHTDVRAGAFGPSTYDLSGILSNVANKFLRIAFEAVDPAWRSITAIRPVNDFKTITSYSLTGDLQYELVPPGGEVKHGQLSQTSYTNKADTYAKMLGVDRRDIINDDLGALSGRVGKRLGRGGALKINDVFWAELLNNAAFFAAGNNNVLTGAGSALSLSALQDADRVFRLQTDPDGKPLGEIPTILLVPTHLRITALNLMASLKVIGTSTTDKPLPENNPFAGAFNVVSSPYMSNASYTGFSTTAHYLFANPESLPVMETCFLNGVELPTVDSSDADLNMLGILFLAFHDFGCKKQEFRGGVRSAGV